MAGSRPNPIKVGWEGHASWAVGVIDTGVITLVLCWAVGAAAMPETDAGEKIKGAAFVVPTVAVPGAVSENGPVSGFASAGESEDATIPASGAEEAATGLLRTGARKGTAPAFPAESTGG